MSRADGRTTLGGASEPLGFRRAGDGGRFAVHAHAGRRVSLELFEPRAERPFRSIRMQRSDLSSLPFVVWVAEIAGLPERFEYGYRVDEGPLLLDPFATLLTGGETWGRSDDVTAPGVGRRYRAMVSSEAFDWQGVTRPVIDPTRRAICELHVRGFTRHSSSGVEHPGTYLGLIEKIPYLVELGVTTVELMPIAEFDETENPRRNPASGERLLNFWGYNPVSFFAPKAGYAASAEPGAAAGELKSLIRELHRAGIEVVVDVVYNHTGEGGVGPGERLHSWRGLAARDYYLVDPATGLPLDLTGCGNTVHCNGLVARRQIVESLRHWAELYRVDGFRFDLAGVFFRGAGGEPIESSPLVEEIGADPVLADRLLIAEPWDATGFSPASAFPEPWLVWDGEFRDAARRFVGGLELAPGALARRLGGFGPQAGKLPAARAVRFVACHDGRPLADVVRYAAKANWANGELNRDGWDGEVAWNGGCEGPSDDALLERRRERDLRMLWALLAGTPGTLLFAAGDERGRTQRGNSNVWCQDNELGWVDWSLGELGTGKALLAFARRLLSERRAGRLTIAAEARGAQIGPFESWPASGANPDPVLAVVRSTVDREAGALVAVNAGSVPARFPIPMLPTGRRWRIRVDTSRPDGAEIFAGDEAPFFAYETSELSMPARSVRILVAEPFDLVERTRSRRR